MGKATSSMTTVVPIFRAAPTAGKSPLRTSQSFSYSAFTSVNFTGWSFFTSSTSRVRPPLPGAGSAASAARVSTRSAQTVGPSSARSGGIPGLSCTERIEARSISSTADTGPPRRRWVATAACSMSGKSTSALALCGWSGDGPERHLGDEGERPLRAHHEVQQDVDRVLVVDEGVEGVAGGVLDPVLLADAPGERLVGGDLVAEGGEPVEQRGVGLAQAVRERRVGGVDLGAVGQHEPHALARSGSCSAPCRSTCRRRCWRRCRRSCRR